MCIAILQRPGSEVLTMEQLNNCQCNNPHGAGFAFVDGKGKIHRYRQVDKHGEFMERYVEAHAKFGKTSPFIVHYRLATHGKVNEQNAHPFLIENGRGAFAHNGIISMPYISEEISDTRLFAREVLSRLPEDWYTDPFCIEIVKRFVGASNKLVFLWNDMTFTIVNESGGYWEKGIWFSNRSHSFNSTRPTATAPTATELATWKAAADKVKTNMKVSRKERRAQAKQAAANPGLNVTNITDTRKNGPVNSRFLSTEELMAEFGTCDPDILMSELIATGAGLFDDTNDIPQL